MMNNRAEITSIGFWEKLRDNFEIINIHMIKLYILFCFMGFLVGRAVIFDSINPFCVSYLATSAICGLNIFLIGTSIILGVFSLGQKKLFLRFLVSLLMLIIIYPISKKLKINNKLSITVISIVCNIVPGLLIFYIEDYFLYDLVVLCVEAVMIGLLIVVYEKAFSIIKGMSKRKAVATDELIALFVLGAFCFTGTDVVFYGLSIRSIIAVFIIMLFSYYGDIGIGTACGMIFGLLQSLGGSIIPGAIGVYGVCGIVCGLMKTIGKIGCPIGFILGNAVMTYYINGSTEVLISFYDILVASLIFFFIPKKAINKFSLYKKLFKGVNQYDHSYKNRIRQYTVEKLRESSDIFNELSSVVEKNIKERKFFSQEDAAGIIERVADRSCIKCGMCKTCWSRDFYKTYQHFFGLLSDIEKNPDCTFSEVPDIFKNRCLKPEEVFINLKHSYELFKSNIFWEKRVDDCKKIVGEQFDEISSIIADLALKIDLNIEFDTAMEEEIFCFLDDNGIYVEDVIVAQSEGIYEITVSTKNCGGRRNCTKYILPLIEKVTGRNFVKLDSICNIKQDGICKVKYRQAQKFEIAAGIARAYKTDKVSGDNYSFTELKDGKYMLALSDGMGTGKSASLESDITISLLEKFLYAGFDRLAALRAINSIILMKSNEESCTTVDMTVVNKHSGEVEFIKAGAVNTFVKRKDVVTMINSGTMPMGILNEVDVAMAKMQLNDGDFIIMVTDGVLDSNRETIDKEDWLSNIISSTKSRNPQTIADVILTNCMEQNKGKINDDMTVLVAKLWKR